MRQRLFLLAALTLGAAACADSSPLAPADRPQIRPNAMVFCNPNVKGTVDSIRVTPSSVVSVGATLGLTAFITVEAIPDSQATINWGDGVMDGARIVNDGAGNAIIQGSHVYTEPGDRTIYVLVGCNTRSVTLSVVESQPVQAGTYALSPDPVPTGTTVPLTGTFATQPTGTVTVTWSDGFTQAVTLIEGSFTTSRTFSVPGVYTVSVVSGGSVLSPGTGAYVPVYDPSGGFVTGGGWIDSPAGAYMADPAMIGKATFGFVAKAKKGQTIPDGNTEFQFHAAKLNFKSQDYEWLVVSGSKATFKGTGTLNGAAGYGFMLTATDGSRTDTFRMKIWDRATGAVVYDNQTGSPESADPTTALAGGSIVVHAK